MHVRTCYEHVQVCFFPQFGEIHEAPPLPPLNGGLERAYARGSGVCVFARGRGAWHV